MDIGVALAVLAFRARPGLQFASAQGIASLAFLSACSVALVADYVGKSWRHQFVSYTPLP